MRVVHVRMMALLVAWLSLDATNVFAQMENVPARDTLGANFDPSKPGTANADAFDFLVGEWSFRFQTRREDNSFNPPRNGHWKAWKSHDGMMLEDEWVLDAVGGNKPRVTLTYRAWNPGRKLWEITGIVPGEGSFEPGIAWSTGDERVLVQHYGSFTARIRYYEITPNHFLWRADGTGDGGKTWQADMWKMEATRVR